MCIYTRTKNISISLEHTNKISKTQISSLPSEQVERRAYGGHGGHLLLLQYGRRRAPVNHHRLRQRSGVSARGEGVSARGEGVSVKGEGVSAKGEGVS